jgi:hypothetical protein
MTLRIPPKGLGNIDPFVSASDLNDYLRGIFVKRRYGWIAQRLSHKLNVQNMTKIMSHLEKKSSYFNGVEKNLKGEIGVCVFEGECEITHIVGSIEEGTYF